MALTLPTPLVYAIRRIAPFNQHVSDMQLARCGLAIGNNLDKVDSGVFQCEEIDAPGICRRQYRMASGRWPVYLAATPEQVAQAHLPQGGLSVTEVCFM